MPTKQTASDHATLHLVPIETIEVGERIRKKHGGYKELATSLETEGQIKPIVLDGTKLLAGGRRLAAVTYLNNEGRTIGGKYEEGHSRRLPEGHILAIDYGELSEIERVRIELAENVDRHQFTQAEQAIGVKRLQRLLEKQEGKKITVKRLQKETGKSAGFISMGLRVADAVEKDGRVELLEANSVPGAYNKLVSQEKLEEMARKLERRKKVKDSIDVSGLEQGDAVEWVKGLKDGSVDLWHFDPPWGIDVDDFDRSSSKDKTREIYDDSSENAFKLMEALLPELYRTLGEDAWLVMWFGIEHYARVRSLLLDVGFKVNPVPNVWYKTNKGGAVGDNTRHPTNVYENFFAASKGTPRMLKPGKNVIEGPLPSRTLRIHQAQKGEEVLREILERYSGTNAVVGDPTFGSGAIFRVAQPMRRNCIGCELNEKSFKDAVRWLKTPREEAA